MPVNDEIRELATFMYKSAHGEHACEGNCDTCWCSCKRDATIIVNEGYRKMNNVLKEIYEMLITCGPSYVRSYIKTMLNMEDIVNE